MFYMIRERTQSWLKNSLGKEGENGSVIRVILS